MPVERGISRSDVAGLTAKQRERLSGFEYRALQLAEWIERDRREPDKVLMYAHELRDATWRANDLRHA